jgi:hypothetical protein
MPGTTPGRDPIDVMAPLFEGHRPQQVTTKLTGKAGAPIRAIGDDEVVFVLIRARRAGVNHKRDGDGILVREQTLTVDQAHELTLELGAERVFREAEAHGRELAARAFGEVLTLEELEPGTDD